MSAPDPVQRDRRSELPGLTTLLDVPSIVATVDLAGHDHVVRALRGVLEDVRRSVGAGGEIPTHQQIADDAVARVNAVTGRRLHTVVNATGVLLHTNLGRAPLSADAVAAIATASGPTNLEVDLSDGRRGGRGRVVDESLAHLTGAAAGFAVNNGAAALVLALSVIGAGREVVISRGELVEIGGSFRLPDIMAAAGCTLREIGTTNRTHIDDYRRAIGSETSAVLRVHPSNFRIEGFVHRPTTEEVSRAAREGGVPFVDDVGSGLLEPHPAAGDEPVPAASIADGADLVVFSGDKLLGGPQAGLLVGRRDLIDRCRRAPLARALRLDKLRLAALESTLSAYERGEREQLPLWAMAGVEPDVLRERAERIAMDCGGEVVATRAVLGGGSSPGRSMASFGIALRGPAETVARRLRTGHPPVVARILDDRVVADLRSVPASQDRNLIRALIVATRPA